MESIYLISDFSDKIKRLAESLQVPAQNIISYQYKENESGYHTWLNDEFKAKEIDTIIIPVSISNDYTINTIGLLLGLHIRLNYELSLKKRLIPIIFLSNFTVENLIKVNSFDSDNNPQNLIFTKGVNFSSFDAEDIQKAIKSSTKCIEADYQKNVLSKLNIIRKEAKGGHDIANAWGCFKVAQVIGVDSQIYQLESIAKHLKQLYAKYLICKNESFSNEKRIDLNPLKCNGKNILFIDDKSDEGWAELMRNLFKGAGDNFKYVDSSKYKADDLHKSFKDFDGFYNECQSHIGKDWDLIFIDLRLNPEKEDIDNEIIAPTDFSGYKLINEFLTKNEGYQIIVLTASNKIWNINAALKRGCNSYFIKESPDYNYPISETKKLLDKFKSDIDSCFQKGFLRVLFTNWENAKNKSANIKTDYIEESNTSLDIAWQQIKSGFLDFGFLTIFQSIENYANIKFNYDRVSDSCEVEGVNVIESINSEEKQWILTYEKDKNGDYFKTVESIQKIHIKPTTLFKISCLLHIKFKKDEDFLKDFGKLNKLRNDIAHGGSNNLATQYNLISVLNILEEIRSV
jgi:CheY-like chemotaxis protein